jgi:hypothetical protein
MRSISSPGRGGRRDLSNAPLSPPTHCVDRLALRVPHGHEHAFEKEERDRARDDLLQQAALIRGRAALLFQSLQRRRVAGR